MLKSFTVFNVEQIDGLAIDAVPQPVTEFDPLPQVEALLTRSGENPLLSPHDGTTGKNASLSDALSSEQCCPERNEMKMPFPG